MYIVSELFMNAGWVGQKLFPQSTNKQNKVKIGILDIKILKNINILWYSLSKFFLDVIIWNYDFRNVDIWDMSYS